ncbi:MAG: tetratricopeptide repeat protein [Cyclobacteriaceae bacterium]|nr:tetratricopeptide repeat protein [Cyclobacteriaceae bacterium]
MPSLISGYEYDIFISYRQKDNKYDGWVTEFVANLRKELEATFKEDVSIYFDENPHDGLLETHDVDDSLKKKLKCLIFIPILSRTYCDPNCFAWQNEFRAFNQIASADELGPVITLRSGNITGRVLPIRIHELDSDDVQLVENELKRKLRPVDFIYTAPGVNRPLRPHEDNPKENLEKTYYRDQINKVANFIDEIIDSITAQPRSVEKPARNRDTSFIKDEIESKSIWKEFQRRNVFRAIVTYVLMAAVVLQLTVIATDLLSLSPSWIKFVGGILIVGFPLSIIFAWLFEFSPAGIIRTTSAESVTNPYLPEQRKPFTGKLIISGLVLLIVFQYLYFNFVRDRELLIDSTLEKSIAVIPFENRGDAVYEYFTDGLTEDINVQLSKIEELRVVAPAAVQSYKGLSLSNAEIAKELGVSYILTGSIEQQGNQIRIAPQLIDGLTNKYIWGEIYNRNIRDVFEVQSEIAQRIADILKVKISTVEMKKITRKSTDNLTAYDHYLKGRSHYQKYQPHENELAIVQFKLAIEKAPDYALAWAGLGDAYNQSYRRFKNLSWIDSALIASKKAIEIDSTLSEGYKSLGSAYYYLNRFDESTELMKRAVALNPSNVAAVGNLGTNYFVSGELLEALRLQKKSAGLNPRNYIPYQIIGFIYRLMGDLNNAEVWLIRSAEIQPAFDTYEALAYVYVCQGRREEALSLIPKVFLLEENDPIITEIAGVIAHFANDPKEAKKYFEQNLTKYPVINTDPEFTTAINLGQILLQEGNKTDSEILLSNAMDINMAEWQKGTQDRHIPFNIASIFAIRGKRNEAIQWLQKSINANWIDYAMVTHGPTFAGMRNDPELKRTIQPVVSKMESLRLQAEKL